MAKGATWMVGLRFFNRGIGLISTIILARLLVPEDFGLVAMATALMALVVMFSELGVDTVLVQKTEIDETDLNSAWSLQVLIGVLQALAMAALAIPIAQFYDEPRLEPVIYTLALAVLIQGFRNTGVVAFRREMTFDKEFILGGVKKLTAFAVTVTLAVMFRSYWALIAGIVASKAAEVALSYAMHPHRPRWTRERWSAIFRFSKWLLMNSGLQFLTKKGPIFVLGRAGGAHSAGIFNVAYEIAMLTTSEIIAPISRAIMPGYARMKDDLGRLGQGYLEVVGIIAVFAIPAGLGVAATADLLVPLALGDGWGSAVPVVRILGVAGAIMAILGNTSSVFLAVGRPELVTLVAVLDNVLLVPGMIFGAIQWGASGVALALLGTVIVMTPIHILLVTGLLGQPVGHVLSRLARPIAAAVLMVLALEYTVAPLLIERLEAGQAIAGIGCVLAGIVLYTVSVAILWAVFARGTNAETRLWEAAVAAWRKAARWFSLTSAGRAKWEKP